jgi:phenylalanyl-tRNA synthetase beta chain
MRVLLSWLRDYVEIKESAKDLAHAITMAGLAVDAIVEQDGETVFDIDITSNRPDAMNHFGVAREIAAIYGRSLQKPEITLTENDTPAGSAASVEIVDSDLCARYVGRVLTGVEIKPAPDWMRRRLELCDVRSINNIADLTNYVLLEIGQPTHAFDLDKLAENKIIVRRAQAGEKLVTLDGDERDLSPDHLAICDASAPVALAGVMGGAQSEISASTTNVLIEAAWFKPSLIRNTSRKFKMHTEASHRFERGADLNAAPWAADRIAALLAQVGAGEVLKGRIDCFPAPPSRPAMQLKRNSIKRHLGIEIPDSEVTAILRALGFNAELSDAGWTVEAASHRLDVEREIDLIEEVARIYGFERFPSTLPPIGLASAPPPFEKEEARVRSTVQALGYDETIGYSFISSAEAEQFGGARGIPLRNPLSELWDVMRSSAVPTMLRAVEWNLNRNEPSVSLAELGRLYERVGDSYHEPRILTLGTAGLARPDSLDEAGRKFHFLDLKSDVETLLKPFDIVQLHFETKGVPAYYREGHAAVAVGDGVAVAYLGELDPAVAVSRKIKQRVFVAEIFLDLLYRAGLRLPRHAALPRVPSVSRDFSLLVPEGVLFSEITGAIGPMPHLTHLEPIEIFRGKNVPADKYSLLLRASWQKLEESFTDDQINEFAEQIRSGLEKKLGITQRV